MNSILDRKMHHLVYKLILLSISLLFFSSCGNDQPVGSFKGKIQDWVHEVFQARVITGGASWDLSLTLKQVNGENISELRFADPSGEEVMRTGTWIVGDGEREIEFDDGKQPSTYFLIKRGLRHAFQTEGGLSNDDGSPILMMRNEGLSRKTSYPINIIFSDDGKVRVLGSAGVAYSGESFWQGGYWVLSVRINEIDNQGKQEKDEENYKYFLRWSEKYPGELELEKMIILRPFNKKDGSKRQSWMSSLHFKDKPRLKPLSSSKN